MLKKVIQIAKEAGEVLMSYYGNSKIEFKNEGLDVTSLVSQADLKSEELILKRLARDFPDHGVYSEEAGWVNQKKDYVWYIDPLDGTSNFLRNIPLWGVSMGLLYKNEPILGVLHFPTLDLTLYAEKGQGAYANNERIYVSKRELEHSLYYSGGRFKGMSNLNEKIAARLSLVKIIDASSYELAQIAMGDAELYELVNVVHDLAAGIIIVREAGGRVTDSMGDIWTPESKHVVISNGIIHDEVINILNNKITRRL